MSKELTREQDRWDNLGAASVGSGGGGVMTGATLLIKSKTNPVILLYGQEGIPWDTTHRVAVNVFTGLTHGYYVCDQANKPIERHVIPMVDGAAPQPPGGQYAEYGKPGARFVSEIIVDSIQEQGLNLSYTAWSISDRNRFDNLIAMVMNHRNTPDGERGFVHPVITMHTSSYAHKTWGEVWHWDFKLADWTNGKELASGSPVAEITNGSGEKPPFEPSAEDLSILD